MTKQELYELNESKFPGERICDKCEGEKVTWFERWTHGSDPHDGSLMEYSEECRECQGVGLVSK